MSIAYSTAQPDDRSADQFRQLLAQVRAGSEEAAWQLVEHYGRTILRTVRGMLDFPARARFDSLDFTQAVWLSFFRHRSQIVAFDSPGQLVKFLATTACHKVVDELRKDHRQKRDVSRDRSLEEGVGASLTARDPTPSQFAVARERWERLLADQPDRYRDVLHLRFMGHTQNSIAETLQIDERTVRKILQRVDLE